MDSPPQHPTEHPRRASGALSEGAFRPFLVIDDRRADQSNLAPEMVALVLDTLAAQADRIAADRWTARRTHDRLT